MKALRISILLLALIVVAGTAWLDRKGSTSWREPLWVGIYPINGDGSPTAQKYVSTLTPQTFSDIDAFFQREAPRYGIALSQPVRIELYPEAHELPPALPPNPSILSVVAWSLKMRLYARRAADVPNRAPPRVRLFVLFHDPALLPSLPDSHGMEKGLIGVIHVFADRSMAGSNSVVIAHELLHTLGATDKYAPGTGAPVFPQGFGDPAQQPRYPQNRAELMAGRRAVSETQAETPPSLREVVVGPATAKEIRWATQ
ncbi:MAG TPA: hypothetical protein VGM84_17925 [Steroidobacteraceae bacterium]